MHHWPITELCPPCYTYEFITKTETLTNELNFLAETLDIPEFGQMTPKNTMSSVKDPWQKLKYFCEFDDTTIKAVEHFYKNDFKFFGYQKFNRSESCQ